MTADIAFVGDVHGNVIALHALWSELGNHGRPHVVFLGDYINRGPSSAEVVAQLREWCLRGEATALMGNHELALLSALDTGDLRAFLKMGAAATIRSYVGGDVGAEVLESFAAALPPEHLRFLRSLPTTFETDDVYALHEPNDPDGKFLVSAHRPVGDFPRVRTNSAEIDTGCTGSTGRLTALLWPGLNVKQVDATGEVITN